MNPKTLLSLLALCLCSTAFANEATCHTITDQYRKHHCLALAKDQVSYCLAIKDNDLKSHCQIQDATVAKRFKVNFSVRLLLLASARPSCYGTTFR